MNAKIRRKARPTEFGEAASKTANLNRTAVGDCNRGSWPIAVAVSYLFLVATVGYAQDARDGSGAETTAAEKATSSDQPDVFQPLPRLKEPWVRIGEGINKVWVNQKTKQVAVEGEICLTKGYLEMFACILGTKEHESVVALHSKAFVIHAGLVGVGAEPGSPAQWRPKYRPASGTQVRIEMEWLDQGGNLQRMNAKQWIRDLKTKKATQHDWVFAGSLFWVDQDTQKRFYRAEGGEIVCVSNFPAAMLDLPIESSQANNELGFEALTENIPKRGTPVRMVLTPKKTQQKQEQTLPK